MKIKLLTYLTTNSNIFGNWNQLFYVLNHLWFCVSVSVLTTTVANISLSHFSYADCISNQHTHQAHSTLILHVPGYNLAIFVKWNHFISLDCLYGVKRSRILIYIRNELVIHKTWCSKSSLASLFLFWFIVQFLQEGGKGRRLTKLCL